VISVNNILFSYLAETVVCVLGSLTCSSGFFSKPYIAIPGSIIRLPADILSRYLFTAAGVLCIIRRGRGYLSIKTDVIYRSNAPTKVTVIGNSILVPVTLVYQGNQVDVQLLLDTGASGTVINTEIADRLNVNLSTARKT
jgi:hypothetical protein